MLATKLRKKNPKSEGKKKKKKKKKKNLKPKTTYNFLCQSRCEEKEQVRKQKEGREGEETFSPELSLTADAMRTTCRTMDGCVWAMTKHTSTI
jgi:hypothetical protein